MRFLRFISSLGLLSGLIDLPIVVAKSQVGKFASRPQSVLKNVNEKQLKSKDFLAYQAVSQRGGAAAGKDAISGAVAMLLIERGINKLFVAKAIKFPAMLAGTIALFFFLLMADVVSPGLGESIFASLTPGSNLLAKWFPVLFVPGLVMLPLAPSIGNSSEIAKFLLVAVLGFVYSLCTTAYTVLFLRAAQGTLVKEAPAAKTGSTVGASSSKPYSEDTIRFLLKSTILSGAVSILATRAGNDFATPIRTVFFFLTTFASYVWGARLPSGFTKAVHPLITSTVLTLGVICLTAIATGTSDWIDVLKTYKVGTLDLMKMGAADIMTFLLGPAVVSFAISMYSRRKLLKENLLIVVSAMLVTSVGGLFGTAAFVRAIQLGGKNGLMVRLSVLSRNVTTALAMACTAMLEGDISLAVTIVVLTGILGATYGRTMLDAMGIYDPVTRGLAVGGAAQGLGVSSMVSEPDAFPFAAMSMILTAISATVLVSIPAVKDALVNICTP